MTPNLDEPKTIEELRSWFKERGYEPAQTRFFVGVDFRAPKAFGIYQDELGEYVVYKNKADGTRVIRYQGNDQEFAVHELYQRFQQEIINQQTRWTASQSNNNNSKWQENSFSYDSYERDQLRNERGRKLPLIILLVILSFVLTVAFLLRLQTKLGRNFGLLLGFIPFVVMCVVMLFSYTWLNGITMREYLRTVPAPLKRAVITVVFVVTFIFAIPSWEIGENGYYSINNNLYYRAGGNWYHYDDSRHDWEHSYSVPSQFTSASWSSYNNTKSHQGSYEFFETTDYYSDWKEAQRSYSESRDYDNDHDSNWSSNDWDSGYTDWNSDW
ncbi:MAG: hypothetical protein J6X94_05285 [Lachnospiraceae bacterium]|nr:hypothetical protein [Lachnospiraceae bacterium]